MRTMYACRVRGSQDKPFGVVRFDTEAEARDMVRRVTERGDGWQATYIGKVKVSPAHVHNTNADPKKRGNRRRAR